MPAPAVDWRALLEVAVWISSMIRARTRVFSRRAARMWVPMAVQAATVKKALQWPARSMEPVRWRDRIGLALPELPVRSARMVVEVVVVAQAVVRTPSQLTPKTDSAELAVVVEQAVPAAAAGTRVQQEAPHLESSSSALLLS